MTEHPIIFSGPMVRALLAGRKTQTRRLIDPQPTGYLPEWPPHYDRATGGAMWGSIHGDHGTHCRYGVPGDRLWVRETSFHCNGDESWLYRADGVDLRKDVRTLFTNRLKWTPSIHMVREASRITLEVTAVRVERLQDITESDAIAEGVDEEEFPPPPDDQDYRFDHRAGYAQLWDTINAKRAAWSSNPWVWVIEFKPA